MSMFEIPEGATQPQDHLPPAAAPVIADDELLADLPELIPPHKLRLRTRNKVLKLAASLLEYQDEDGELNFDASSPAFAAMLDVLADTDDFAQSIAADEAAYVAWAEKAGYEHFTALLMRYASAVGESLSSSR